MGRITRELTNIQNDAAGKKAQIVCPVKLTYDKVVINYTGTSVARSDLQNIKVIANGETIQEFSDGDRLDQYNDYYGRADTANYLTLYFNRPEMNELDDQRITGLGTADLKNLVIEMDIDATAPGDFALAAHAVLSPPQPMGVFTRIQNFAFNSSVSGQVDVNTIIVGPRILAIHGFKSDISDMEVFLDEVKIYDLSKAVGEVMQKEARPVARIPQTSVMTSVDFTQEGDLAQAVVTAPGDAGLPLLLKPTLGSSGSVTWLVEYLDSLRSVPKAA